MPSLGAWYELRNDFWHFWYVQVARIVTSRVYDERFPSGREADGAVVRIADAADGKGPLENAVDLVGDCAAWARNAHANTEGGVEP